MCTRVLNGWRRIATASMAGLALWLANAPSARADVTVTIKFDFVETRVSPRQEVFRSPISETFRISADKGIGFSASTGLKGQTKFGDTKTGTDESGRPTSGTFRVIKGAVVITSHNVGYYHVLKITTDGRTACSATKTFFRNPGHQYFEYATQDGRENIMASNLTAENMTCSIGE
jgi:hypothetical protein